MHQKYLMTLVNVPLLPATNWEFSRLANNISGIVVQKLTILRFLAAQEAVRITCTQPIRYHAILSSKFVATPEITGTNSAVTLRHL